MTDTDVAESLRAPSAPLTLRVTFAYRGHELEVIASERVAMIAPGAATPVPEKGQTGYWFEVRDAAGELLFHRSLHNPIRRDTEVFSHLDRQTITRVPVADPHGEFELLVTDTPAADVLRLYGPSADVGFETVPSRELFAVPFEALRRVASTPKAGPEGAGGGGTAR